MSDGLASFLRRVERSTARTLFLLGYLDHTPAA
jgi:hypothetical protein